MNIFLYQTKVFDKVNNKYFRDDNNDYETLSKSNEEEYQNKNINELDKNSPSNKNGVSNNKDNNFRKFITLENNKDKFNKIGTPNETRFTTLGLNNDSKTIQLFSNNLASLNTIENEKQSTITNKYKNKKRYINNFNTIDSNEKNFKTKRHKVLKDIQSYD